MKPYPSYKDSGVEWIGEIPSEWKLLKVKNLCKFGKGQGLSKALVTDEGKNKCILYGELYTTYKNNNVISEVIQRTNESDGIFSKGIEILIPASTTTTGVDLSNAKFLSVSNVKLGGDIIILFPMNDNYQQEYLSYFLTYVSTPEFVQFSKGVTIFHIYPREIREISVSLPQLSEQQQIVSYLNRKTQQIDELIEKTERKIELLKEKRTSLINHCVTKGLDPIVKMKESGVEWIGEIPSGWETKKLKCFSNVVLGKMLTNEDRGDYYYKPYLRSKNIQVEKVAVSDTKKMWFSESELLQYRLKKNDLLVSEGGDVGRTCIWNNELEECYIQNSVHKVTVSDNSDFRFFLYHFQIHHFTGYFDSIVNRVSIPHLTKEKLINVSFLVPPKEEQEEISHYLDTQTQEIDTLIEKENQWIELLKEYRQSLISEVVTGKIDVRDEVVV